MKSLLALCIVGFFACSNNQTADKDVQGTPQNAEDHNDAKFDNENEKDAAFVVDAANANLTAISLCDLAMNRATHQEIKDLAKTVSEHHLKANNELNTLAQSKNITMPTSSSIKDAEYKNLNEKSGNDFDKAFYDKIVAMHKETIDRFEKASQDAKDADLRNYAASQLPTLRAHLDRAMDDQKLAENWK